MKIRPVRGAYFGAGFDRKGCSKLRYKNVDRSPRDGPTPTGNAIPGTIWRLLGEVVRPANPGFSRNKWAPS